MSSLFIPPNGVCPSDHHCIPAEVNSAHVAILKTHLECMRTSRIYQGLGHMSLTTHVEREFHQLNCKFKTFPISCLSFLASG